MTKTLGLVCLCGWLAIAAHGQRPKAPGLSSGPKAVTGSGLAQLSTPLSAIQGEPTVRVRIRSNQAEVVIDCPSGTLRMGPPASMANGVQQRVFRGPIRVQHSEAGYRIQTGGGQALVWQLPVLEVLSSGPGVPLVIGGQSYPGDVWLHFKWARDRKPNGLIDTINHVPLETYIPGVIQKELYGSWGQEAFRAQAIAARSYFFYEKKKNEKLHYDLESTTASQVYTGIAQNPKAVVGADSTRGVVVAYQGHVLPTFYCSSSGGIGQDAHGTFPGVPEIKPLNGFNQGDWGKASNRYRWAMTRSTATLARQIAAWGRANGHAVAGVSGLQSIRVKAANAAGRPKVFEITDAQRRRFLIAAESLRLAVNDEANGLAKITPDNRMYSAHASIVVSPSTTRFTGRGFGHGVGMCQWSAQAMSQAGHSGEAIVGFFYPGTQLRRVY